MNKILKMGLVLVVALGLTACGGDEEETKEVTLKTQTVNEMTLDVPEDFAEFKENGAFMISTDSKSTGSIVISAIADAQGSGPDAFTEDVYKSSQLTTFTDVEMVEFTNDTTFAEVPVVYAHLNAKNSKGVPIEMYNYIFFFEGGAYQSIVVSYSKDVDSSLKANVTQVLDSIVFN